MHDARERHERLQAVFDGTLRQDPAAREAYLDRVCAADGELRAAVARLLAAHDSAESFLERPGWLFPALPAIEEDFRGTVRFAVRRRLGVGGMGVVYEVDDTVRHEVVALKTLRHATAADTYHLKREFRSLADVVHPNLVCLYELFADDHRCFFTMELVPGSNFVEYVRGTGGGCRSDERVVSAFGQLVDGVSALHRLGKLHRDIKPPNVLVTDEGRVVILDFGLIAELVPHAFSDGADLAGGTPAYMAPETGPGIGPTEAADWYAVGVTLFEALTGQLPFAGPASDVLRRKRELDPPSPADLGVDVPRHLSAICLGLLHRNPAERLTGAGALRRLGHDATATFAVERTPDRETSFIGRARELAVLGEAFRSVAGGETAAVCVSGPSGIGKSVLARHFLERVQAHRAVLVLSGRCYERESVPYKALDSVVDSLSRYLKSLPRSQADDLVPADVLPLLRLFPVLRQVDGIVAAASREDPLLSEPHVLRQRGFGALRNLLARIAAHQPLVMAIDDVQWSDVDSAALIQELLRPPEAPVLLLLVCCRSEDAASPVLRRLFGETSQRAWSVVPLWPMDDDDAQTLIGALAPPGSMTHDRAQRIAREAQGNPFLLEQLTRYLSVRARSHESASIADMVEASLGRLPPGARPFLETLAVCGRPVAPEVVAEAARIGSSERRLVALLRAAHFIRSSGSSERIEIYHDRIREALVAHVSAEGVCGIHGDMARTLVARQVDDPEALFEHYAGAGAQDRAAEQAILAARTAMATLAVDRAAWLYRQAVERTPVSPWPFGWRAELAEALANAGRPAQAAEAYLATANAADSSRRAEFQRRGAEQFLIGGHIDRGMAVTRDLLRAVGIGLPRTPLTSLASLVWHRARLQKRGLQFVERDAAQIAASDLSRLDTYWAVTTGLAMVDMLRASDFSARHARLALDTGDPARVVRALAMEGMFISTLGHTHRLKAEALIGRARAIADQVAHPYAMAVTALAQSMAAICTGRWQEAHDHSQLAVGLLRDRCAGVTWEVSSAHILHLWSLMYLGELSALSQRLPPLLSDALDRGNLALATELRTRMNMFWLAADEPDEGERHVRESLAGWSHTGMHRQHYSGIIARAQTELYRGHAENAWGLITTQWPRLRRSQLFRVQVIRIEAWFLRGRSALALAARRPDHHLLATARADARRIASEATPWSNPLALLVGAGVAYVEGDLIQARHRLLGAVDGFDRAGMTLYAAVARRRLAALQEGAPRRETERRADVWMTTQQIRDRRRFTRAFASGFGDEP
jgi:hypothetical protein